MIKGIGTDIVEIGRIQEAIEKNSKFLHRIFSQREVELFSDKKNPYPSYSANFAGKEAVLKVFGTGLRGCSFTEIEILRDALGKPYVVLSGEALKLSEMKGIEDILISLSHEKSHAIAYAIGIGERLTCC